MKSVLINLLQSSYNWFGLVCL